MGVVSILQIHDHVLHDLYAVSSVSCIRILLYRAVEHYYTRYVFTLLSVGYAQNVICHCIELYFTGKHLLRSKKVETGHAFRVEGSNRTCNNNNICAFRSIFQTGTQNVVICGEAETKESESRSSFFNSLPHFHIPSYMFTRDTSSFIMGFCILVLLSLLWLLFKSLFHIIQFLCIRTICVYPQRGYIRNVWCLWYENLNVSLGAAIAVIVNIAFLYRNVFQTWRLVQIPNYCWFILYSINSATWTEK
jgi:hypothetical protein